MIRKGGNGARRGGRPSPLEVICLTPPGLHEDPALAVAASRAGAIGILDLTLADLSEGLDRVLESLARLDHLSRRQFGVRLDCENPDLLHKLISDLPGGAGIVLLSFSEPAALVGPVARVRELGLRAVVEATRLEEAEAAVAAGADGVIARGHECGGPVGEETTLVLLQRLLAKISLPLWAQGGIGLHTAAACYAGGAAGVVLDMQLALARESRMPETARERIRRMDGSETACAEGPAGERYRIYAKPGCTAAEALLERGAAGEPGGAASWRAGIGRAVDWSSHESGIWPLGQDAAFAAGLADRYRTVGGIVEGLRRSVEEHLVAARRLRPLEPESPLARAHDTLYPIVQGPMTRVSDAAPFARDVARAGGLPFLALALLRAGDLRRLLEETRDLLGDRPWGVGILGFVPLELRREQLEVIREFKPRFALIAGGRPDQAAALEADGIATYLHVPSPGLLKLFIESGSRRFVFEGRECGGHVGPRSSFVLWNTMVETLLEAVPQETLSECHILFAGGVHDALSASIVSALAAPLAERGAKVGALMGTAYLFTREAVSSGAIVEGFQQEAVACDSTVLLETGPGHASRCSDTAFAASFRSERQRLAREGRSPEEIRNVLEEMNLGRLRIASKGITRNPGAAKEPGASRYLAVDGPDQREQGMYMIGQVAALRDRTCGIEELHKDVSAGGTALLESLAVPELAATDRPRPERPSEIAIVGMSCLLPKAASLQAYWENILRKVDAITEVPRDRWDWRLYYDPDPTVRDRIYSKWGGFLDDVPFDPMRYGMPPNTLSSIEPLQLLTLELVRDALEDSGYLDRPFDRSRTSVMLGAGGGVADLGNRYGMRAGLPTLVEDVPEQVLSNLPEWTEDSFAGILLNVAAGRVANRFDFGGTNTTVDAACASSLAAVYMAVRELESGAADMVIAGGADTVQNPFGYLCFSKTKALSPRGRCSTFDAGADGIVISEGLAALILKRLSDAERDGDRIYGVIRGIASSSDGRDKGLTAPRREGQMLALDRAYGRAGYSPATVELIEAHGTGTVAGDIAEVDALKEIFDQASAERQECAIGSVKSMIGHTKCTAGVASLVKICLALYHKVLPPTLNVESPSPKARFPESPFYVNTELRPWIGRADGSPRRAGVSAFGFGGTNFHATVEEYRDEIPAPDRPALMRDGRPELLIWRAGSRGQVLDQIRSVQAALASGARPRPADLARSLWERARSVEDARFAAATIVAPGNVADRIDLLCRRLETEGTHHEDPSGLWFTERPLGREGKIAFLFPGQGSQYPGMLTDLSVHFHEVRSAFERADRALAGRFPRPLSRYVYPPPSFTPEERNGRAKELTATNVAQPALGAADIGVFRLLGSLGVAPEIAAGHSYGEYVALCAAGVFDEEVLAHLSEARGRSILEAAREDLGTMAAIPSDRDTVARALDGIDDAWIANLNAPLQTVISGSRSGVERVVAKLKSEGIEARLLPVACAFHSPLVAPARDRLAAVLDAQEYRSPGIDVYSNTTSTPYPRDGEGTAALLAEHLVRPVLFADGIEAMYAAGARLFVEAGPKNVLTSLTRQTLGERPHAALAVDVPGRDGLQQLLHSIGLLAVHGAPVNLDRLFEGRSARILNLDALVEETREKPLPPTTWLINGGRARPLREVEKEREEGVKEPERARLPAASAPAPSPARASALDPAALSPPGLPASGVAAGESVEEILTRHQELMNRFLETQRSVMLAALGREGAAAEGLPASGIPAPGPPVSPVTPGSEDARLAPADPGSPLPPAPEERAPVEDSSPDPERVRRKLLDLVSERTGYPPEMLSLDVDMESDLGIDSIKRVEILGAMQQACLAPGREPDPASMESLNTSRTLGEVIRWFETALAGEAPEAAGRSAQPPAVEPSAAPDRAVPPEGPEPGEAREEVPRYRLVAVPGPVPPIRSGATLPGIHLITEDPGGTARALAERIRRLGGRPVLVRPGTAFRIVGEAEYEADLGDHEDVARLLHEIREREGAVSGVHHLLPLTHAPLLETIDLAGWRRRLQLQVKSFYHLARAASGDLLRAAEGDGAWLYAATNLGGGFGLDGSGSFPGQGGIAGLMKTAAVEWPSVRCRLVDLHEGEGAEILGDHLIREILHDDGEPEVGYREGVRNLFRARPEEIDPEGVEGLDDAGTSLSLTQQDVILVTGGARGITAEVAVELATRHRPTLILAGRSPLPAEEEPASTRDLETPREIKAALMESLRAGGEKVSLPLVETAYNRLTRDREIRDNLARLRSTGARVEYRQVDVRDEESLAGLVREVRRDHGRLDGVIHGAGIIEDKLLVDKLPDSFDRVFDTKADSVFILSRVLDPESLRFLVLFSSVAGPYGSRGQGDYAAANEVMTRLASHLDSKWKGRVVSISWGPWGTTGMAGEEVQRQFRERGVQIIPPAEGRALLEREIRLGREAAITLGGGPWRIEEPEGKAVMAADAAGDHLPLLNGIRPAAGRGEGIELTRSFDVGRDLYLADHCLDGNPVVPYAVAMELMAEVGQRGWPDLVVTGVRDLQVLKGMIVDNGPKEIRIAARAAVEPPHERVGVDVGIEITDTDNPAMRYYRATLEMSDRIPPPPDYRLSFEGELQPFGMSVEEAYRKWLFHGPLFQGIEKVHGICPKGMVATLASSRPEQCLVDAPGGDWLIDPIVFDSGLQMVILWARQHLDVTPLPSRYRAYRRFGSLSGGKVRCDLHILSEPREHLFKIDILFVNGEGSVVGMLEEMECPSSRALNRLAGGHLRSVRGS